MLLEFERKFSFLARHLLISVVIIRRTSASGENWHGKIIAGNIRYSRGFRVVYF